jgi:serine/threonine protein kinase
MAQVCQALAAAHAKGIVHRDLKPENIYLITRKGDPDFVKVLDFGISKMKEAAESLTSGLTKTGMALGTPYYMAPEQAQGLRDVDHRTDVYALGVILFESLTGSLPYDADTYPLLMVKIMTEAPPLLRSFRPDLPAELEHVVLRAIAKSREERFQTVEELSAALQPFRNLDGGSGPSPGTPRTWSNRPWLPGRVRERQSGAPRRRREHEFLERAEDLVRGQEPGQGPGTGGHAGYLLAPGSRFLDPVSRYFFNEASEAVHPRSITSKYRRQRPPSASAL